jgi:hypothetical protein
MAEAIKAKWIFTNQLFAYNTTFLSIGVNAQMICIFGMQWKPS